MTALFDKVRGRIGGGGGSAVTDHHRQQGIVDKGNTSDSAPSEHKEPPVFDTRDGTNCKYSYSFYSYLTWYHALFLDFVYGLWL